VNRPARRAVEANLLRVIGRRGRRWHLAVRGAFRHGARNYYDTLRIPSLTAGEIAALVPVRGWEHLDAALAAGTGAILVGAHLSSIALAAQTIAARGHTIHIVVEPVRPPELLQLLIDLRSGVGLHLVPLGPRLGVELLAALRRNEVVGLIVDRDVAGTGICVPFFGEPTRLPSGPAMLALRSGAAILPVVVVRRAARIEGLIEPPIPIVRGAGAREDVRAITRAVTARLEYYIGRHPEQWTVFQPVWDTSAES
jgi:lauroyl/myristoyl acyltransferase